MKVIQFMIQIMKKYGKLQKNMIMIFLIMMKHVLDTK